MGGSTYLTFVYLHLCNATRISEADYIYVF